jgi:hypothetical protein
MVNQFVHLNVIEAQVSEFRFHDALAEFSSVSEHSQYGILLDIAQTARRTHRNAFHEAVHDLHDLLGWETKARVSRESTL